jgi:hypothetical protein
MTSEFIIGKLSIDDDKLGVSLEDIVKLSFNGEDIFLSEFNIFTNDKITYISYDKILTINKPSAEALSHYSEYISQLHTNAHYDITHQKDKRLLN